MKKIILRTVMLALLGLLLVMLLVGCVKINLKSNAVYYAKNMPRGEGQEPELIMLIDNLWWVDNPDIEGLKYDIDGTSAIIDLRDNRERIFNNMYLDETMYVYIDEDIVAYRFNRRFELLRATNVRRSQIIDINSVDKNKIVSEIKSITQPVIDKQSEPIINLQWIFNLVYQDEFK